MEANLAALIESTDDPIWSVDLHNRLITFNRALVRHVEDSFGVQLKVGMKPEDLLSPQVASVWPPLFDRARKQGAFRIEHLFADGRILLLSFNPIFENQQITGVSIFGKDISEIRRLEGAARASEVRFRRFFEENGSVMLLVDPTNGLILDANQAASTFYGYTHEQMLAMPIGRLNCLPDAAIRRDMQQVTAKRGSAFERRHRLASGEIREMELHSSPIEIEGRTVLISILHDATERKQAEEKLRSSEERYRATFEQAAVGIIHTGFDGKLLNCNHRFAEIVGYSLDELLGMHFQEITLPEDLDHSAFTLEKFASNVAETFHWEKRYLRKDGSLTWVKLTASLQRDAQGTPLHAITVIEDINARKEAEAKLAETSEALGASEKRYRTAFQTSFDAIQILTRKEGRHIDVNQSFLKMFGYDREEVIGKTSVELQMWADLGERARFQRQLDTNNGCHDFESKFRRKNGEIFWMRVSSSWLELEGELCIFTIARDITDAKRSDEEIRRLAYFDALTGLPNRRLFLDRLRHSMDTCLRSGRLRALMFIDLDHFKEMNDTFGHATGDLLLMEVARRLTACVRRADTLARLGGDEFVVILEELSGDAKEASDQARTVGEKILGSIGQCFDLAGVHYCATVSVGIAIVSDGMQHSDTILRQADQAMYQAKAAGRNTLRFFGEE